MNTQSNATARATAQMPPRSFNLSTGSRYQPREERQFGTGYGRSSGYAAPTRYAPSTAQRLFRCV